MSDKQFYIPMSDRERVDHFYRYVRDFSSGRPEPTTKLSLMDTAKGVVKFDGLIVQSIGIPSNG